MKPHVLVPTITGYVLNPGEAMPTECPVCYRFTHGQPPDPRPELPSHEELHLTDDGACHTFNNKVLEDPSLPAHCTCPYRGEGAKP